MSVSPPTLLKGIYNTIKATGRKAISSDATMMVHGLPDMVWHIKQFPWPILSSAGEIEQPMPLGSAGWTPQQTKTYMQGPIMLSETVEGRVQTFMEWLLNNGGEFNATAYEGVPDAHTWSYPMIGCMITLDQPDRDWENRAQLLNISGTMFYHYFGDRARGTLPIV